MIEDLLKRPPVHPRLAEDLTLAHLLDQNPATNVNPLIHVAVHLEAPCPRSIPAATMAAVQWTFSESLFEGAALMLRPLQNR